MKNQFTRMKRKALSASARTLALAMCLVMLLTAVGAATLMTAVGVPATGVDQIASSVGKSAYAVGDTSASSAVSANKANVSGIQRDKDIAGTGAKVEVTGTGSNSYKLQTGARYYLNTYASDGKPFSNSATKAYVYIAFIWNDYQNYSIIKMDHIANTDWYTCVTADGNIVDGSNTERRGDMDGICFFTSDSSSWATKSKYFSNKGAFADIQNNAKVLDCYASDLDGRNAYNGHSYYYSIAGNTWDYSDNTLADSATQTKTEWQKTTVYTSTDGSTYNVAAAGAGGEVQIGSYYWATAYTTSDKGFAPASDNSTRYSQYDNAVVTSWVTLKVTDTYDGWHFIGWYDSSGNPAGTNPTSTTNYYQITSTDTFDVHARFLKPEYTTTGIPANASLIPAGTLLFKKASGGYTPTYGSAYNFNNDTNSSQTVSISAYNSSDTYYCYQNDRYKTGGDTQYPRIWLTTTNNSDNMWNWRITGLITEPSSWTVPDSHIWYAELLTGQQDRNWQAFTHLGITLSGNPETADPGDEITLSAPTTGTKKSGALLNYYYRKNDTGSWYVIAADTTAESVKFYPPEYGTYKFKVTVADTAGLETAVADSATTTTVGQVGYYVTGDTGLVGQYWGVAPYKGFMTAPSSGTVYTKTFGNVASGAHSFRITSLTDWITDSSTHGTYTVNGAAGSMNGNDFTFSLSDKQQVTITYDSSNHNVTVTTAEVQAIDVVVYAGNGGTVEVTYGTAVTEIPENENVTIKVAYGDKIDLETTANGGYEFEKWYKNLTDNYKGGKEDGYDSLEDEVITSRTVYVAVFSGGSGSSGWTYSADRTAASPEISGSASSYHMIYSSVKSGLGRGSGDPRGDLSTYQSGSDYWGDLTSVFGNPPSSPNTLFIALSTNDNNSGIRGDKSNMKINGTTYTQGNGPTFKNASDETLFAARFQEFNEVSGTAYFIELYNIDWSKITALGVRAVYTGSGGVNYKFYYKLKLAAGETATTYIPSTNYYAKDGTITGRDDYANLWFVGVDTVVTPVEGQVTVTESTDLLWEAGMALKGSQITVTTTIPGGQGSTTVQYVDRNGNTGTCKPAQKYYVAGFSFNGVTPELYTWNESGVYSCTYTIPADMKETMLEITPIYFIRDEYASETVMVYLNGFNEEVKNSGWGNTLYVYPFYQYFKSGSSGTNTTYNGQAENFGRYPGQPVINYGGQLFMQIPLNDDASADGKDGIGNKIKGITINNGYNDYIHKDCCSHVSVHKQTYDYDDFAKIYNEKKTKNGEKYLYSIYFSFKYYPESTTNQHRLNSTTSAISDDNDASRYNDLVASGNILSNTNGTVASAKLIAAGESSTGWQDLTDALGNKVDIFGNKVTNASAEPLRVFSLGYEFNNAGRWATEWAVYHLNGENYELVYDDAWGIDNSTGHNNMGYNSSIVPSALNLNSASNFVNYPAIDGDQPMSGYEGLYTKLTAYAGVPVKICYEHETPDNKGTAKAYRSDGRWTYTTVDDFVRSSIKIEYYDKDGVLQNDTFVEGTHVGNTTGCSAYFTNSAYYGATVSNSEIIDNTSSYTFKAENVGSYEFVGWYMYDTAGHESTITTTSLTADTPRSGNFVLVARFKYIASGNLVISNTLNTNSIGRGTTYLGVTVKNGDKETIIANVNSNTESVTLGKSYINANSNYQIKIDLRTVPSGENTFKEYVCYTTNGSTGTDVRSTASNSNIYAAANKNHTSDTYTVTVKASDIFSSSNTNTQIVKAIEYVSELNPVHYNYSVKFNYTSRQYGNQAFTRTGTLTAGQINDTSIVTGTLNTADKKLTKAFLAEIAPHESNLNTDISWNFDAVVDSQTCTYTSGTNTYTISLTIANNQQTTTSNVARHGYFTVPYAQTNGVANADGSGKTAKTAPTTFTIDVNYDDPFYTSGTNFVTAPAVIYETISNVEHTRHFKYWEISTAASNRGDAKVVGKCYNLEFNYRALDNYNITAVYSEEDNDTDAYNTLYSSEAYFTSIAFIGNSRNQWNSGDKGSNANAAGDLIYNDFILTFKPTGNDLFKKLASAECGFIIQRLKEIETNASGANAKTLQEYAKDYTADDLTAASAAALAKAGNTDTTGYTQVRVNIGKANVNNKNRCHYAYSMYNSKNGNATNNAKYLYRAYSYMKIGDGAYIISDEPTYFYMYDIAQE